MKFIYIFTTFLITVSSGDTCNKKEACVGTPRQDCICTEEYKPVCGCDGKTYSNACNANCAGVKTWKEGECPAK